jgi:hypothetical protein
VVRARTGAGRERRAAVERGGDDGASDTRAVGKFPGRLASRARGV